MEAAITCLAFLLFLLILFLPFVAYLRDVKLYKQTSYYRITKNSYHHIRYNKGASGEYKIFAVLQSYEQNGGKFLFNLYLPRGNSQTTEIDLILITNKGLFVFESKNFDGWIFGNEAHKNWTQSLPRRSGGSYKSSFYNPIKQNAAHIRHLRQITGYDIPVHSVVVFSDACTLKSVTVNSDDVRVIKMQNLLYAVAKIMEGGDNRLTDGDIMEIYDKLLPYTLVKEAQRVSHMNAIRKH